jgi:hypothetical protein
MATRLVLIAMMLAVPAARASAQNVRGFAGAAVTGDVNNQHYNSFGGGALVDLGTPWLSAGAQAEALVSWPYFAGRGALFAQGNVVPAGPLRPFLLAGFAKGEESGALVGGGAEFRQAGSRLGFRVSVEDYVIRYTSYDGRDFRNTTGHQVAVRGSVLF